MTLTSKQQESIHQLKIFIDNMPFRKISLSQMIEFSGLSKEKINEGFKSLFKITPHKYCLRVAMERAASSLKTGTQVKLVSLAAGYKKPADFTKAFKSIYGITPSEYLTAKKLQ